MTIRPAYGATVMATGIVSIALALDDQLTLSRIWLGFAAMAWLVLGGVVLGRLVHDRSGLKAQAQSPAALTGVAATAVLGSRLAGAGLRLEADVLLGVAVAIAVALYAILLQDGQSPRTGTAFMPTVAVQSLAVLAAVLASSGHAAWLTYCALAACVLGIALYALMLVRFDGKQLLNGKGDHWVAGGALAISALAISEIALASARTSTLHHGLPVLHAAAVVVWAASVAWIPALVAGELAAPRLAYDVRRWATVFPVGMYAAASYETARASHLPSLHSFATADTWIAVAVCLIVATGMIRRGLRSARR